jgi:hypothetical protein
MFAGSPWTVNISKKGYHIRYDSGLTQTDSKDLYDNYVKGLCVYLLGDGKSAGEIITPFIQKIEKRGLPQGKTYSKRLYTLLLALSGIINHDEEMTNRGLLMQLVISEHQRPNGSDDEFICQHAVSLANLAIRNGMKITIHHPQLPKVFMNVYAG